MSRKRFLLGFLSMLVISGLAVATVGIGNGTQRSSMVVSDLDGEVGNVTVSADGSSITSNWTTIDDPLGGKNYNWCTTHNCYEQVPSSPYLLWFSTWYSETDEHWRFHARFWNGMSHQDKGQGGFPGFTNGPS